MKGISEVSTASVEKTFGDDLCRDDRYCEAFVGNVQVQAMGGMVELLPSSQDAPETYVNLCAGALAGLGDMDHTLAATAIAQSFTHAATNGETKLDVEGVEFTVHPEYGDRLACEFWRP